MKITALLGSFLLAAPAFSQSPGTDVCLPGQNGVMACPCNNPPAGTGKGCANFGPSTSGQSASLTATGVASVTDGSDTLSLMAVGTNDTVLTVFLQASSATTSGAAYGAGVGCLSGTPLMLYHGKAGTGEPAGQITRPRAGTDPAIHTRSATLGSPIQSGQTRIYMVGYRDKAAALATHCNSAAKTSNSTQGVSVVWGP
jgi:hypothetical protein